MTKIFSNVVADIDTELEGKFPTDFDYLAMIRKVSEDAGVDVQTTNSFGDKHISLQGIWVAMERVHSLLATALAVYGARVTKRDTPTPPPSDVEQGSFTNSFRNVESKVENPLVSEIDNDERPLMSSTSPQNSHSGRKSIKSARLRKKCTSIKRQMQMRTRVKTSPSSNSEPGVNQDDEKDHKPLQYTPDEERELEDCFEKSTEEGSLCADLPAQTVKRKRGRPRKYPPGFQSQRIYTKFRSKFNRRKKYSRLKCTANDDSVKVHRGRGRPRKFPEGDPDEFPCPECDFVAKTRNTLGDHKHRVHLASPTMCDICQKVFPNRRYMRRHRSSHVEPQHCCDVCGKMYKIRKAMVEHKKTHEEGYARPSFPCDQCPKSFCSNYILSCHVKSEHLGQKKSFLCSVCGKSFTTKHSLQEHLNAHTGAKPHICEICGKGFCYESALRDHKFVHVGAKQFICEVCSKAFTQRSGLKMHMRIHQVNKQFMCSDCGREFTQKQALQRHERVHKGDKPFICRLCSRTFSDASIIRRHMILVHKIHKDASTWREDIICKVQGALNYHVEKISEIEENVGPQIPKSSAVELDVLAAAAKAVELPVESGATMHDVSDPKESTYATYKHSDVGLSNSSMTDDHSQDTSDQSRQVNQQHQASLSQWYPSRKHEVGSNHVLLKDTFTPNLKQELSGSAFLDSQTPDQSNPQSSYIEIPSRPHSQETLQLKVQEQDMITEGHLDSSNSASYLSVQQSRYAAGHNSRYPQSLHINRTTQYTPDSCRDPEDTTESFSSELDRTNTSQHYSSTMDRGERPASYPQVIPNHNNRQLYTQENPDYRERQSHVPLSFAERDERPVFSQENPSPSDRASQYPSVTSPPVRSDSSTAINNNSSSNSNFPTSATQPWSSMYAYYSHLASQFGMTLSDYPYMTNPGNSHQ